MIIRWGLRGAATALAATLLLTPRLAAAQGLAAFNADDYPRASTGNTGLGLNAGSPTLDPQMGPNGQDAPPSSTLTVRVYNAKMEYARGFVDLQLGKFREAESEFDNALYVQPDDMKILYMLGVARSGVGDLKGALQAYQKALKVDPLQVSVRREYAVTLARLGETDKAEAQLGMLKLRADACGGSCAQADDFKAALARVQAALSGTLSAPG